MRACWRALVVGVLGLVAGGPPGKVPGEVTSEVADFSNVQDSIYFRVDAQSAARAGVVGPGAKQLVIRLEALTRGRAWPGRWTMVEVEARARVEASFRVGFGGEPGSVVRLPPNVWTTCRLALPGKAGDLSVVFTGEPRTAIEFRKLRLVDDHWTAWSEGWQVGRAAGVLTVAPRSGEAVRFSGEWTLEEVGAVRAVVRMGQGKSATVYAGGQVFGNPAGGTGGGGGAHIEVGISEDFGRVDRGTGGDADGDGFNEVRGATMLKAVGNVRRMVFTVRPGAGGGSVSQPVIEIADLPAGELTVIWDGKVVKAWDRVSGVEPPGVLIQLPGEVKGEGRVEVSVEGGR